MRRIAFLLTLLAGCAGTGQQTYQPSPMTNGSGTPRDATSVMCAKTQDCAYWFCSCADGAVVNSAVCDNGWCLDANGACPPACQYFSHGAWTGQAQGGPIPTSSPGDMGSQPDLATSCGDQGTACRTNADCCSSYPCSDGICGGYLSCKPVGTSCSRDGDCGCAGESCGGTGCCVNVNHTCNDGTDCCAGLLCNGGLCQ